MDSLKEGAYKVVKTVASPLRFFAVASIILGAVIIALAWKSVLPAGITVWMISIAFFVLMALIILVAFLVVFAPKKLVFDQEAHLSVMRERLGDSELPSPYEAGMLPNISAPDMLVNGEEK